MVDVDWDDPQPWNPTTYTKTSSAPGFSRKQIIVRFKHSFYTRRREVKYLFDKSGKSRKQYIGARQTRYYLYFFRLLRVVVG